MSLADDPRPRELAPHELSEVLTELPTIVSLSAADGAVEFVSSEWERFSGRSAEDFVTGDWLDAVHDDDRVGVLARWSEAVRAGEHSSFRFRARAADGSDRRLLARGRPIVRSGTVRAWVNCAVALEDEAEPAGEDTPTLRSPARSTNPVTRTSVCVISPRS